VEGFDSRFRALVVVLSPFVVACARGVPAATAVTTETSAADSRDGPPVPRQPDGVFLDSPAATAPACGSAPLRGVVSLCPPPSRDEAISVARAYFRVFAAGDPSAFSPLLAHDARRLEDGTTADLAERLDGRMRRVDYAHLAVDTMVDWENARLLPFDVAPPLLRGPDRMHAGDVLVELPMRTTQVMGVTLFGARVALVLRSEGHPPKWKIAAVEEDGPWP